MFRLGEPVLPRAAGATFSLGPEFLDSQEKGLVIFRAGGGGGGGTVVLEVGGTGLGFGGDSAFDGDHGIEGREDAMLLRESFFVGCFCAAGTGWSSFGYSVAGPSPRSTLSKEACESRFEVLAESVATVPSWSSCFSAASSPV